MKTSESCPVYKQYRDEQIAWASTEDLILIMANELIRLKDETGMNLFWDGSEEQFLRDYIESADTMAQN